MRVAQKMRALRMQTLTWNFSVPLYSATFHTPSPNNYREDGKKPNGRLSSGLFLFFKGWRTKINVLSPYLSAAAAVQSAMEQGSFGVDVVEHGPGVVGHRGGEDDGVVLSRQGFKKRVETGAFVHL